jgi:catechol 2,3-dioxygenase-like lactoylglutathione lyase family enzyme
LLGFEFQELPPEFSHLAYFLVEGGGSVWLITHGQTPPGDRFSEFRLGLDHLAFTAPSKAFLDELATKLIAAGVPTNGVELFANQWYYVAFRDPDNIQLEYWLNEPVGGQSAGE